jgi:hypothetical protein
MYSRPAAPRSIGGVLDDAIRLYRASFVRCWPLSLAGAILVGLATLYSTMQMASLQIGVLRNVTPGAAPNMAAIATSMARLQRMWHSPLLWLSYLVVMAIWLVFRAAIMRRQDAVATNRDDSIGEAVGYAVRRLPEIIIAGIVFLIAITVGSLLFVIPGIWLWGALQLWLVALCLEDLGPFKALGRSWRLIDRHWWRTSTTVGVAVVIIFVLSLVEGVVVSAIGVALRADPAVVLAVSQLLAAVLSIFTMPMLTVAMLAIFYDLRLRREGGDLAARVSSL